MTRNRLLVEKHETALALEKSSQEALQAYKEEARRSSVGWQTITSRQVLAEGDV